MQKPKSTAEAFSIIRGEMAERVRTFDWAATPLGPIAQWPQSLKTAVGMILLSPVPIVMLWGEDGIMVYNDGYSQFAGQRHPSLLGSKVREGWPEVADFNDNIMKVGLAGGTLAYRDFVLSLNRTGTFEPVWLDLDYSPILDESGKPAGVMAIVVETTERVRSDQALRQSEERLRLATENAEVGLWHIDAHDNISFFSAGGAFSVPQDRTVTLEEFMRHVRPEDLTTLRSAFAAARDPKQCGIIDVEYRTVAMEGIPARWMAVKGRGSFDADGNCIRMSGTAVDISKRKDAELQLRQHEEQLRLATEHAEIGLWDVDNITDTLYWPARVKAMFGISPDAPVSMADFYAGLHLEDRERTAVAYAAASDPERRALYDVEYRTVGKEDGAIRWVHAKGRGVFDASGRCVRVIGTAIDITRQKETAEALRQSEENLRLATASAEIGLWDMDVVHNRNYPDARVKAMFGLPSDADQTPEEYFAQLHPEDVQRVVWAYRQAFDPVRRPVYDVEYRITAKDGVTRWIAARGRGVFDAEGTCIRVIGTAIDITRQKETAEALRQSEEQLRLATEFADVGLWDIDVVSDQLYWPRRVNAMFGLPPDAPISPKQFRALIHPEDRRRVVGAALASCDPQQRTPYDIEYRIVRANDAAVRWMTARGKAVFENERCTRMLGIIVDITARKEIEQQLQELNETLEKRVAERTAALEKSEAQIRQAEQALQQAQKMEAIGNLTGGIAHDFNNLLQGVAGSLDLIRRNPADLDRVRRWAEAGLQAAGRGAKLTAQLLAFSRSQKLELRPVELAPLVMGMEDLLGRTLGPAIRLSFDLDSKAAAVLGDETQIELAVLNLAINARDAMPSGGELKIAMRRTRDAADAQLASGEYVELSVTDSGTGMPPEIVERAFDPFFTTKGVGKGTGLGLSQVYAMARQAGGIARIRSSPGRGATVSIFLPVTHAAPQAIAALAEQADAHPAAATILVIDDDRDVRRFLADSLDSFGYAVLQAEDGPAGLDALARHAPDLAIIDYAMPGMTGAEVAQQIRMNKPGLPIIFASGYAETSALDGVTENATVLRKPFRVSELQNAVRTALGQ